MKRPPDMSRKQFQAALKAGGMRQVLLWVELPDKSASIGMLLNMNGKVNYRASLAKAIREFEKVAA